MTTLNLQVGASADDARQSNTDTVSTNATAADSDGVDEHIGLRWTGVTIAGGATIDDAICSIHIPDVGFDEPKHQIRGEDADNAGAFTTGNNDIDGRTRTTASVQWNSADLGIGAASFQEWGCATAGGAGASVASIVQEIVDRAGWAEGNALVMIFEQHTSSDTNRDLGMTTYDGGTTNAAKLDIDYTAGAGGGGGEEVSTSRWFLRCLTFLIGGA